MQQAGCPEEVFKLLREVASQLVAWHFDTANVTSRLGVGAGRKLLFAANRNRHGMEWPVEGLSVGYPHVSGINCTILYRLPWATEPAVGV